MIYGFHSRADLKKEIVDKGKFEDYNDAVIAFAKRKQLAIDSFTELYEVIWLSNYL